MTEGGRTPRQRTRGQSGRQRQPGNRLSRWAHGHERTTLTIVTAIVLLAPILMVTYETRRLPVNIADQVIGQLRGLWIAGLLFGVAVDVVYAARGRLIIRSPAQILANRAGNQRLGLALVPVAIGAALVLGRFDWHGVDLRVVILVPLAGFLLPLLAVVLYITFRIRPDELFSSDPAIAAAANERLRGPAGDTEAEEERSDNATG